MKDGYARAAGPTQPNAVVTAARLDNEPLQQWNKGLDAASLRAQTYDTGILRANST